MLISWYPKLYKLRNGERFQFGYFQSIIVALDRGINGGFPLAMVTGVGASSSRDAAAVAIDDDEDLETRTKVHKSTGSRLQLQHWWRA